MVRWHGVAVGRLGVLALLGLACSSSPEGSPGDEDVKKVSCVFDEECASGKCIDGECLAVIPSADVTAEPDALTETHGKDDALPQDTAQPLPDTSPPEDVTAGDTGGGKPLGGQPDIMVDPLSHTFTYVPGVYNPETKTVTVYNEGTGTLIIDQIAWKAGSSPEFTFMALPPLPKKLAAYEQAVLTVVFKEKSPHGKATLQISSNDADEGLVEVQFNSQSKVGDQPCIGLSPTSLNFGQVVRGESKALPFTLSNCSGTLPLKVDQIVRSKFFGMELTQEFQMVPKPVTPMLLAPNQAIDFQMTYTPGLAGMDSGYFEFYNNDPTAPKAKLDVHGVGVPPPLEEIGLHIELEWDQDDCDVDLHLVRPGGTLFDCESDCYYANMNPDWGTQGDYLDDPFLDYDDVDGFGPENTNLSEPMPGVYKVTMHYYNDTYEGMGGGPTAATVRVYSYGVLLQEFGPTTLQKTDKTWDVCNVTWPGAAIQTLGNIYEAPNQPVCFPW
jgi:hypothetical protein